MKDKTNPSRKLQQNSNSGNGNGRRASPKTGPDLIETGAEALTDDENRIDWEKKQKRKRAKDEEEVIPADHDEADVDLNAPVERKKGKKDARKKRRQLVYDEDSGQVVVKRKYKRKSNRPPLYDQVDDWDEVEFD